MVKVIGRNIIYFENFCYYIYKHGFTTAEYEML